MSLLSTVSTLPQAPPVKKNRASSTPGPKKTVFTLTYSPPDHTDGCPDVIMNFIQKFARKYYVVQETASKRHVQAVFITRARYCRSWGCKQAERLRKTLKLKPKALIIHPHANLAGAIGYQDGDVLANEGFDENKIKAAVKVYKLREEGKYYRDHVNTMISLNDGQATAIREHIMHKKNIDPEEAERLMVAQGHIWPRMKDATPYIRECMLRDALGK